MNYGPLIYFGVVTSLVASWLGFVAVPRQTVGKLHPDVSTNAASAVVSYPSARSGEAAQGRDVYQSLGCSACHTMQVRPASGGSDIARGWGKRRTVARDYLQDPAPLLGSSRLGPDLANYGERLGTNSFALIRLYNPRQVVPGSICTPAPFLFETRPIRGGVASADALALKGAAAPEIGTEIVPGLRARQLAAFLASLNTSVDLPEAPLPVAEETASK